MVVPATVVMVPATVVMVPATVDRLFDGVFHLYSILRRQCERRGFDCARHQEQPGTRDRSAA
jgi:hypothetical protein